MCNEDKGTTIKVCLLILVGVPPNACKGRVCHVEREDTMAAQPFVCHWTMVSCFHASLHFLQDIPGWRVPHSLSLRLFLCTRAPYFHPFRPSPEASIRSLPRSTLQTPHFIILLLPALAGTHLRLELARMWHTVCACLVCPTSHKQAAVLSS